MPWKRTNEMLEKADFIKDYLSGKYYVNRLCEHYGISRKTGYKIINRYKEEGDTGLHRRSSRPRSITSGVSPEMESEILRLRHPTPRGVLGARKIGKELLRSYAACEVPSSTTIHKILMRHGLVKKRKDRRRIYAMNTKNTPRSCNEIWTIDYKGHFKLGNRRRCHPLTLCDSYGRYILQIKGQYRETSANVRKVLRQAFQKYGQPQYLLSDNGSCFASIQSPCGYGSLSYWLIDHGISPLFIDPGVPGQNGRHERMHKDLKAYCCRPAARNLSSQNRLLNEFTAFYNTKRPHEELDDRYPCEVYRPSEVAYRPSVKQAEYDLDMDVRRVTSSGALRWGSSEWVMINSCLAGKWVGLRRINERSYEVYYRWMSLGFFELGQQVEHGRFYRLISDRDLPQRQRDHDSRRRKG